ncbi:hypothetical protein V6N13_105376 [Hibiscus sabdariffa]
MAATMSMAVRLTFVFLVVETSESTAMNSTGMQQQAAKQQNRGAFLPHSLSGAVKHYTQYVVGGQNRRA